MSAPLLQPLEPLRGWEHGLFVKATLVGLLLLAGSAPRGGMTTSPGVVHLPCWPPDKKVWRPPKRADRVRYRSSSLHIPEGSTGHLCQGSYQTAGSLER
jgi:hypothetical protein